MIIFSALLHTRREGRRLRTFKFPFNLFGIEPVMISTNGFRPPKAIFIYHILISPSFKSKHLLILDGVAVMAVTVGNCYSLFVRWFSSSIAVSGLLLWVGLSGILDLSYYFFCGAAAQCGPRSPHS